MTIKGRDFSHGCGLDHFLDKKVGGSFFASSSECFAIGGGWFEDVDRALMTVQYSGVLALSISQLFEDTIAQGKCGRVSEGFSSARGPLSIVRVAFVWESLFTGKTFLNNACELKSWSSIASNVLVFAARNLSLISYLHDVGAYNLGANARKILSETVLGIWAIVIASDIALEVYGFFTASSTEWLTQEEAQNRCLMNAISGVCDLAAYPFENGYFMDVHPGLTAFAAVLCIFSAVVKLGIDASRGFDDVKLRNASVTEAEKATEKSMKKKRK